MKHDIDFLVTGFTEYCDDSPILQDEVKFLVSRIEQLESIDGRVVDSISGVGIFGQDELAEDIFITYYSQGKRYEKEYTRKELVPRSSLN